MYGRTDDVDRFMIHLQQQESVFKIRELFLVEHFQCKYKRPNCNYCSFGEFLNDFDIVLIYYRVCSCVSSFHKRFKINKQFVVCPKIGKQPLINVTIGSSIYPFGIFHSFLQRESNERELNKKIAQNKNKTNKSVENSTNYVNKKNKRT